MLMRQQEPRSFVHLGKGDFISCWWLWWRPTTLPWDFLQKDEYLDLHKQSLKLAHSPIYCPKTWFSDLSLRFSNFTASTRWLRSSSVFCSSKTDVISLAFSTSSSSTCSPSIRPSRPPSYEFIESIDFASLTFDSSAGCSSFTTTWREWKKLIFHLEQSLQIEFKLTWVIVVDSWNFIVWLRQTRRLWLRLRHAEVWKCDENLQIISFWLRKCPMFSISMSLHCKVRSDPRKITRLKN